jgi:hypothetical protein
MIQAQSDQFSFPLPKSYTVTKTTSPLTIDGKADEESWSQASWTEFFTDIEGDVKPAPYFDTRMKMLWDEDFIYFYVEMEEEHVWGDITERDAVIFYNNDFEIFIKPNQYNPIYAEFEVNALGTLWDLLLVRPYRRNGPVFDEWDVNGTKIGIDIRGTLNDPSDTDQGWNLEMAIPIGALKALDRGSEVRTGTMWRINFSRVQWEHDIKDGIYSKKVNTEGQRLPENNWVWTPQHVINMHQPERWGYLYFVETPNTEFKKDPFADEYQFLFYLYRAMLNEESLPSEDSVIVNGIPLSYEITTGKLGFEITVTNETGLNMTVNQDGYIKADYE